MSQALYEAMQYSNEDSVEIKKHWIVIFKAIVGLLIKIAIILYIYRRWGEAIFNIIFDLLDPKSIPISRDILPELVVSIILMAIALKDLISAYLEYKTVGLQINNSFIKGKSGVASVGIISASLDKISNVKVLVPLWGRIFHYGTVEISLLGYDSFLMKYMVNAAQFQEAVMLFQEAQVEGRNIRQAERQGDIQRDISREQTMMQVQAMSALGQTLSQSIAQGIAQNNSDAMRITSSSEETIEEIGEKPEKILSNVKGE